jgi:glycosyltransferase involved in cell wall biosynthesis
VKRILHIIESLKPGGAENLLCNTVSELTEYQHLIVTVFAEPDLSLLPKNATYISLNAKHKADVFLKRGAFKKIIKHYKPALVHAHLYFATVLAKAFTPPKIPLLFTQHFEFSKNTSKWYYAFVDKLFSTKEQTCLAVSNAVLQDYVKSTKFGGQTKVIGIYIPDRYFSLPRPFYAGGQLKMVALGNVKPIKNQRYLLEAFALLKDLPVMCDVYGEGPLRTEMENEAREKNINVFFKGQITDSSTVLSNYHLYIMPSLTEGFPLALFEAMATGLPPAVSDIPVFHELLGENASYLPLGQPDVLRGFVEHYLNHPQKLVTDGDRAKQLAAAKASKKGYLQKIRELYTLLPLSN